MKTTHENLLSRRQVMQYATWSTMLAVAMWHGTAVPLNAEEVSSIALDKPDADGNLPAIIIGQADAPVHIVEYASMTCPHCAAFHANILPQLKRDYVETGKARIEFREFPLDALAAGVFMLARCAPNNKALAYMDVMYARQREWAISNGALQKMLEIALEVGFTQDRFRACLTNQALLDAINKARADAAEKYQINSTPSFVINGEKVENLGDYASFKKLLDAKL